MGRKLMEGQPMVLSRRGILIRNGAAALVNGLITLVLLLIAPLGLAAVITNTVAVILSTFVVCGAMDIITWWLLTGQTAARLGSRATPKGSKFEVLGTREEHDRFPSDGR